MFHPSVAVLMVGLFLGACGSNIAKRDVPEEKPAEKTSTTAASEQDLGPTLAELTQAVRKYSAEQRRAPESLNELVSAGYLNQLPSAPGKRFFIDKDLKVGVR
jgi:hypothetical protein